MNVNIFLPNAAVIQRRDTKQGKCGLHRGAEGTEQVVFDGFCFRFFHGKKANLVTVSRIGLVILL